MSVLYRIIHRNIKDDGNHFILFVQIFCVHECAACVFLVLAEFKEDIGTLGPEPGIVTHHVVTWH